MATSDTAKSYRAAADKREEDEGVPPQSFMAMMVSGALMFAVRHWDEYKADVAKANPASVETLSKDAIWEDAKESVQALSELLQAFSLMSLIPGVDVEKTLIEALVDSHG